MKIQLTTVFKKVKNGYIGYVEELSGANTQGETFRRNDVGHRFGQFSLRISKKLNECHLIC